MKNKISVIGGAGFVGTNLCQLLENSEKAFEIIDLKPSYRFPTKSKIADVRDIESIRKTVSGDIIVNLAAIHRDDVRDPSAYYETNVLGAENISKVAEEFGIKKIIFTSSVAVYGDSKLGVTEGGDKRPTNPYGHTKYLAEKTFLKWQVQTGSSLTIIRPTVIFGEGNRGNVYNLLKQIADRRFIMVGNGKNKKSMAYIGNIAAFLEQCISSNNLHGVYNYVDSPDLDMNSLVQMVRNTLHRRPGVGIRIPYWLGMLLGYASDGFTLLTGRRIPISSRRVKKFCATTVYASATTGRDQFQPPFSLEEGLHRTLQSEFIDPDPGRETFYTE